MRRVTGPGLRGHRGPDGGRPELPVPTGRVSTWGDLRLHRSNKTRSPCSSYGGEQAVPNSVHTPQWAAGRSSRLGTEPSHVPGNQGQQQDSLRYITCTWPERILLL